MDYGIDSFHGGKIRKQLNNIKNEAIKNEILEVIMKRMTSIRDHKVALDKLLSETSDEAMKEEICKKLLGVFYVHFLFLFDAYTIGRMFRNFDDYTSNHSIVYAGGLHIHSFDMYLRKLKQKGIVKIIKHDTYGKPFVKNDEEIMKFVIDNEYRENKLKNLDLNIDVSQSSLPLFETAPPVDEKYAMIRNEAFINNDSSNLDNEYYYM